jgi:hypothetical protein
MPRPGRGLASPATVTVTDRHAGHWQALREAGPGRRRRVTVAASALWASGPEPAQPTARGLHPLGTPVGPVRVVKITMASVVEGTERALSEVLVEQGSAQARGSST